MELSFSTTELREICERHGAAIAALGIASALHLEQRLADIEAADTVADFIALFPDKVVERSSSELALRVGRYGLVFCSGHVNTPLTSAGATDWQKVTRMRIMAIEGDHE